MYVYIYIYIKLRAGSRSTRVPPRLASAPRRPAGRERPGAQSDAYINKHIYIYIYIYVHVCMYAYIYIYVYIYIYIYTPIYC